MRLRRLTLQHFRNIALAELSFAGRQQFFVGPNGQGKTNLLEAVGFVTALRSFRTADTRLLIGEGQREAAIGCDFEHDVQGATKLVIRLHGDGKEVTCDGERVTRLADHLGRFPTVVFSSQDQQLIRGAPALRRRWLDLTLAGTDPGYLHGLQNYHRALAGRNQLLKRQAPAAELAAFEQPLGAAAAALVAARRRGVGALAPQVAAGYALISSGAETAGLAYAEDVLPGDGDAAAWHAHFERTRARDLQFRGTMSGPHRDDLELQVGGRAARDFGSEGQQRSLVLALRLAQVSHVRASMGIEPVLLADDVLGELDPTRRRRFWSALGETRQVLATGTELPDAELGAARRGARRVGSVSRRGRRILGGGRIMNFDTKMWILAGFAAMLVGISKTGVPGIGMLFVAIFANLMPAKQSSGFVLPLLIFGDVVAVVSYRRHTEWKHLWRLFPWTAAGVGIGALAMGHIDNRQAKLLVGGIILTLVVLHVVRKWQTVKTAGVAAAPSAAKGSEMVPDSAGHGAWFAPTIGVLAGFTTLVANAAGSLMAIYLLAMRLPKMAFVGTSAVFFLLLNLFKVPFMVGLGLITADSFKFNLILAPAVLAGAWFGRWVLPRISQVWFERLALILSAAAGLKLLMG